ncbi:hypothetical protein c7_R1314 [Megavirus courdo7]|uniref:Uncharacterized protein n=1 Tax=Megavirus courdo7 TaxID=1128135 RepID=H2ECQ3_9VIRU|nr:hypothetical protein c7_R1314 [Megavirus courdo7]
MPLSKEQLINNNYDSDNNVYDNMIQMKKNL